MAKRLTTFSKFLITLVILTAIVFGGKWILDNTEFGQNLKAQANQEVTDGDGSRVNESPKNKSKTKSFAGDEDVLIVQIFTWGGYAPGIYYNYGLEPTERSRFYKDYGLKVKFQLIDDFNASRQAWRGDRVHLIGTTADALPTEMEGLKDFQPKIVLQADWSRGGDAIIARRGIKSINDLKGKKVAFTPTTPSQTFLLKMLEAAGMGMSDIDIVETPDNLKAAAAFKSGKVDAAVVWSPDDEIAVSEVPGSSVLESTRNASHIIADVFIVKNEFLQQNKEKINQFYEGWMKGAAEINANQSNAELAARLLAEGMQVPEDFALTAIENVRLCTHGDNRNFFGLNPEYRGVDGDDLYTGMGDKFASLGMAPADRPDWRRTAYMGAVMAANLTGESHDPEEGRSYTPPTEQDRALPAKATKKVSISFASAQYKLTENAKTIIDLQFADIAKSFGNMRVRVEGNTDNVGSRSANKSLSVKRAQSVAEYLQTTYNMDPNRFIIVGNGPDKPVPGCENNATKDCKAKNRRTEFQLIAG